MRDHCSEMCLDSLGGVTMSELQYLRKSPLFGYMELACTLVSVLILRIDAPGYGLPGPDDEVLFVAECPYCREREKRRQEGVTCSCGKKFVVTRCDCEIQHAAVGIQDRGWYCSPRNKWSWARLCPQCRALSTPMRDGSYQCPQGHASFRMGRCEQCHWLAGEHPDHYLLCEFCGHRTTLKDGQ